MLEKYVTNDYKSYEDYFNRCEIKVPENFNFAYDIVDGIANQEPDRISLVWCDDKGNEKFVNFDEMKRFSSKAANYFKQIGITKGDKVMLILKRRYEFWYILLALHKIGAVAIPATHMLTKKDIVYRNNAADIKLIVATDDENAIEAVESSVNDSPTLKHKMLLHNNREGWLNFYEGIENADDTFERPQGEEATQNSDSMLLYFTSGTTGHPKMVQHNFSYPLGHITTAVYWQNVKDGGLHYTVADTGWAKAAWGKIYGQWIGGSAVFVYDFAGKFEPVELLKMIEKYNITTGCAPPTIYRFLIKEDIKKYDLSSLKYCVIAGEPLNPEVFKQFLNLTGIKLMEGYGQTELTLTIGTFPWMEPRPGSMGKPSPGYDIDIIDEYGNSCDVGKEGQIVVKTDKMKPVGMFDGYYRDEEKTNSVWHDDVYYTGDMAWRDEEGYFWFVGRADDVIKSSGYRIGPFEVESALLEHPAVLECAITGVPHPVRGQVVKATVVLSNNYKGKASDELVAELQDHVKNVTAPYKYPRIIEFVDELPKTISGKIRRVQIREEDKPNE